MSFKRRVRSNVATSSRWLMTSSALASSLLAFSGTAHAQGIDKCDPARQLTRAEVLLDLELWRRAGVDKYEKQASYGVDVDAYDAAYKEYLRLRSAHRPLADAAKACGNR